jgi:hypothetical protein
MDYWSLDPTEAFVAAILSPSEEADEFLAQVILSWIDSGAINEDLVDNAINTIDAEGRAADIPRHNMERLIEVVSDWGPSGKMPVNVGNLYLHWLSNPDNKPLDYTPDLSTSPDFTTELKQKH